VMFGGYFADHYNRKKILLATGAVCFFGALALALLSWNTTPSILRLYMIIFLIGVARGFGDPASTAFEAQVVPKHLTLNAASWTSSVWIICSVSGPASIGFVFDAYGAQGCYLLISVWFLAAWLCLFLIKPGPQVRPLKKESVFKSIGLGWRFVFSHQPLLAALALDLFAVLFGGTVALLPVFAESILHVGAKGLGFLNAAPPLGALVMTLLATRYPPQGRAGRTLLFAVAGFGVSILVFAFSRNFLLSLAALFASGVFDGISVIIRRSMVRLLSPEDMRGRVAAANWVFVAASNELGAFESGMLAALIGTVPCVIAGGTATLIIVAFTALFAKELRNLRLSPHRLDPRADLPSKEEGKEI
jgi:MFS family permease